MSAGADQGVSDSLMWDQHIETKLAQEPEPKVTTLQSIYREVMILITQNFQEKETATAFGWDATVKNE